MSDTEREPTDKNDRFTKYAVGCRVFIHIASTLSICKYKTAVYNKGKYTPLTVKRVMKRFIELSDGSKWDLSGYPYPRKSNYWPPKVVLATPALMEQVRLQLANERVQILLQDLKGIHINDKNMIPIEVALNLQDQLKSIIKVLKPEQ